MQLLNVGILDDEIIHSDINGCQQKVSKLSVPIDLSLLQVNFSLKVLNNWHELH